MVISLPYIFQVLYVLCFTRPRYQVSVYKTIGIGYFLLEKKTHNFPTKISIYLQYLHFEIERNVN